MLFTIVDALQSIKRNVAQCLTAVAIQRACRDVGHHWRELLVAEAIHAPSSPVTQECAAAGGSIDLVLTDMQMPVMDGYTLATRLRESVFRNPIITLTTHALAGDREKCLAVGCNDYTSKPIQRAQLLEKISVWLGQACRSEKVSV